MYNVISLYMNYNACVHSEFTDASFSTINRSNIAVWGCCYSRTVTARWNKRRTKEVGEGLLFLALFSFVYGFTLQ